MTIPELGKLESVPVRNIWPDEARNFTPWLAENLDRLGVELEMDLELSSKKPQQAVSEWTSWHGTSTSGNGRDRKPIGMDGS